MLSLRDASLPPPAPRAGLDARTLNEAREIVRAVRCHGESALRSLSRRFGDIDEEAPLVVGPEVMQAALRKLSASDRALLERTAERITRFAQAQIEGVKAVDIPVPGGRAGLHYAPMRRVGCYAPGGRYPLPSSVLMTALTARVAGVAEVWVASPRPAPETLAAAALAGAQRFLCVGGAQAIAALAYGAGPVLPCELIVGPGNRWVSAAKQVVSEQVAIDMVAGPSELVVLADAQADARCIAADLLAQAEHDPDALPVLLSLCPELLQSVNGELGAQLSTLPTAEVAAQALAGGCAVLFSDMAAMLSYCDRIAPEHVALHLDNAEAVLPKLRNYGAAFVGEGAAEVLGDYGAGPNHVLPTAGSARRGGALSVLNFLRAQTWLRLDDPRELAADAARFGRIEGLEAHARAADLRLGEGEFAV